MRVGILVSHPIQYYTPLFRVLAQQIDLQVFYATRGSRQQQAKAGFGVEFDWDIDLLSGYSFKFLHNVSAHPSPNRFRGCDTPEILEIIRQGHFDAFVVFGWYLKSHWQAIRACKHFRVPVLVRGDSQLRGQRSTLKTLGKEVTHWLAFRQFDGFLAVGKRNREYLLHYGAPAQRIFPSPHFVDNGWFAAEAEKVRSQKSEIRTRLGIPQDAFCLLFCGKFIPKKRPLDLVKAAQLLINKDSLTNSHIPSVHLLFVGSGALGTDLRARCNVVFDAEKSLQTCSKERFANDANPPASFVGFQNQTGVPAYYASADVLVLPSDGDETWGLVVNEAMACGLPAIVSDAVGCGPDLIVEEQTGFTFPLGDIGALAERVERFVELKRRSFQYAEAIEDKLRGYSVEAAANGLIAGVDAILSAKKV